MVQRRPLILVVRTNTYALESCTQLKVDSTFRNAGTNVQAPAYALEQWRVLN